MKIIKLAASGIVIWFGVLPWFSTLSWYLCVGVDLLAIFFITILWDC